MRALAAPNETLPLSSSLPLARPCPRGRFIRVFVLRQRAERLPVAAGGFKRHESENEREPCVQIHPGSS